jgi:2-haloacid dehalogenase
LTFDVFGTVVDYRSTIIREGQELDPAVDWGAFSDAWRSLYRPSLDRVLKGELPWTRLDDLERVALDQVLAQKGISLSEPQKEHLNRVWERLDAWPDAAAGLTRLKGRYIISPLSNGSVRQMVGIAKHAGLPWDVILCGEVFRTYKPDPRTYLGAAELLQLEPGEVMMVAAHVHDLRAARSHGLRTAFVARPLEWGPGGKQESPEAGEFDVLATDFLDLAQQLGA